MYISLIGTYFHSLHAISYTEEKAIKSWLSDFNSTLVVTSYKNKAFSIYTQSHWSDTIYMEDS